MLRNLNFEEENFQCVDMCGISLSSAFRFSRAIRIAIEVANCDLVGDVAVADVDLIRKFVGVVEINYSGASCLARGPLLSLALQPQDSNGLTELKRSLARGGGERRAGSMFAVTGQIQQRKTPKENKPKTTQLYIVERVDTFTFPYSFLLS